MSLICVNELEVGEFVNGVVCGEAGLSLLQSYPVHLERDSDHEDAEQIVEIL